LIRYSSFGFRDCRLPFSGAEKREINQRDNTKAEQKRVTLKIADLKQSQERADAPRSAAASAHCACINDPSINESCDAREELLSPVNQPAVKLVEIKLVT
jgi:hypothetical protein